MAAKQADPHPPIDLTTSIAGEEDPGASIELAQPAVCPQCGGTGRIGASACPNCEGTGKVIVGIGGA